MISLPFDADADASNTTYRPFAECAPVESTESNVGELRVAIREAPPFIYNEGLGKVEGIAIELWESIATELKLPFRYICLPLSETKRALSDGTIDIAISPLTITKEREKRFDFSHQYFNSGLVFASKPTAKVIDINKAWITLEKTIFESNYRYIFILFLSLTLLYAILALIFNRNYININNLGNIGRLGLFVHLVLLSIVNTAGFRKDVLSFNSTFMQIFSFIILVFGITLSASLFAMVTASLTQSSSSENNITAENMLDYPMGTLANSTAHNYIREHIDSYCQHQDISLSQCKKRIADQQRIHTDGINTWQQSVEGIIEGDYDIVLGDWVQLSYLARNDTFKGKFVVLEGTVQFEPVGWGLPSGSTLREPLNQSLIGLLRSPKWIKTIRKHLGEGDVSPS